jgi:hypothetical protein
VGQRSRKAASFGKQKIEIVAMPQKTQYVSIKKVPEYRFFFMCVSFCLQIPDYTNILSKAAALLCFPREVASYLWVPPGISEAAVCGVRIPYFLGSLYTVRFSLPTRFQAAKCREFFFFSKKVASRTPSWYESKKFIT